MSDSPNSQNFSRHPMLLLAIAFVCGVVLGRVGAGIPFAIVTFATLILIAAVQRKAVSLLVPLAFIPLGAICYLIEIGNVSPERIKRLYDEGAVASHDPVEIEGALRGVPEPAFDGAFLRIRVEKLWFKQVERPSSGTVRLFVIGYDMGKADLRHGSIVRIACRLEREDRYLNPGVASRTELLDQQGIDATGTVKSPLLVEKLGEDSIFIPLAWAYEQRLSLVERFRDLFSSKTAGVMTASLLGEKHFLDRETADVFREGGTFHVLVISGLHITFIGGLTLWLVSLITRRPYIQAIVVCSFLWAYTFAVGAETPVVRASIMFTMILLGRIIYRQSSLLNALGTCTLLLLVWRPSDIFSASFQLTFVSVAAIVGCAFPLIGKLRAIGSWSPSRATPLPPNTGHGLRRACEFLYWNETEWVIRSRRNIWSAGLFKSPYVGWLSAPNLRGGLAYIIEGLIVSTIVQAAMLPLVIVCFHRVTPAGLVLNLWVGVLLALESFAAIAAVMVAAFSTWLAAPLIELTEAFNVLMMSVPSFISAMDSADIRVPIYSGGFSAVYFLYAIAIVAAAIQLFRWDPFSLIAVGPRRSMRLQIAAAIVLGGILVLHPFSAPSADGRLRIDFLDVGQGDSALITFPEGKTMLVDGGGSVQFADDDSRAFEPDVPRIGEMVVSEFLWERGYSRIDYLVATHADADHIQGLVDVAENFDVGVILLGNSQGEDPDLLQLLNVAERKGIELELVRLGDHRRIGGVDVDVLNPESDVLTSSRSTNNQSIVFRLGFGSRAFLFTGDIERDAERELENLGALIIADVVKVPHHGSRTSSSQGFVDKAKAQIAVISVGRRSRFGHPHREVVERWRDSGADVRTTGQRGTITIETDGESLDLRTFKP